MDPEGVQCIVVTQFTLQEHHCEVRDDRGKHADDHGSLGGHETSGWCDNHKTSDCTRAESKDGRLAFVDLLDQSPDKRRSGGSQSGRHESLSSDAISSKGGTCIETIPADPEHARSDHDQHHRVRSHLFFAESGALAQHEAKNQSTPTGAHVNHGATRKVDGRNLRSAVPDTIHVSVKAPHHVCQREVNNEHPDRDEQHHGGEFHTFCDGTDNQSRSDDREHQLIHRKDSL